MCVNYAFCIIILSMSYFVFCSVHKFITFFSSSPMGSVYWFHSAPCICACLALCLNLSSQISQWIIWQVWSVLQVVCIVTVCPSPVYHFFCGKDFCNSYANHSTILAVFTCYKNGQEIILKIRLDRATRKEWWASENVCDRNLWGMEHISDTLFDNLMHFKYYRVCIGVRYDVCKLGNSHSPLYTGLELYI